MVIAAPGLDGELRLDLKAARVLCADESAQGLDILGQILMGFGVQNISRAQSASDFRTLAAAQAFDLMLIDAGLDGAGYELVRWLRREGRDPNRTAPMLLLAGHTPQGQIETARDCGASFVLIKPISARVLLDRIVWIGRAGRLFVETEGYVGPDRRFRNDGVPGGGRGRRHDDLSTRIGAASEPNMSQDEIDTLMKPQKVSL